MATAEKKKVHCLLCGTATQDPVKLGIKIEVAGVVVHFFCAAFSTGIYPTGPYTSIGGQIKSEIRRGFKNKCTYCRRNGATIECITCKVKFHLPCGLENGAMSQSKFDLPTYCKAHRPRQKVNGTVMKRARNKVQVCVICYDNIDMENPLDWIWPPCCRKYFYHRNCVQIMAMNHGCHMKCCLCQNSDKFNDWIIEYGVYVPERDPTWLSNVAFQNDSRIFSEQIRTEGYPVCKAEECLCPYGRATFKRSTIWDLHTCHDCLKYFTHYRCSNIITDVDFKCPHCSSSLTVDLPPKCNRLPGIRSD